MNFEYFLLLRQRTPFEYIYYDSIRTLDLRSPLCYTLLRLLLELASDIRTNTAAGFARLAGSELCSA